MCYWGMFKFSVFNVLYRQVFFLDTSMTFSYHIEQNLPLGRGCLPYRKFSSKGGIRKRVVPEL